MATERATSEIPIEEFDQDVHDPDEYFERLETAMELATGVTDADRKAVLLKKWLSMKLNAAARMILKSCDLTADWETLIAEFKSKLVTPQDKYNWRSRRKRITWDGVESFHVLAEKAKRTVDRYEDDPREKDYFFEFRQALPRNYQQAIDYSIDGPETLEKAKKIALRLQAALSGPEPDDPAGAVGGKSVSFVGGSMSEDWMDSMEKSIQKLTVSLENRGATIAKIREARSDHATHCAYNPHPNVYSRDYHHPHESSHSRDDDRWGPRRDTELFESRPEDEGLTRDCQDGWTRNRHYESDLPHGHPFDNGVSRTRPSDDYASNPHRDYSYPPIHRFEYDNSSGRQSSNASSSNRQHDSFSSDRDRSQGIESRRQRNDGDNDYHFPPSSYQW